MPCGPLRNSGARLYNLLSVFPAQMEPTMPGTTNVMRSLELRASPHSRLACQSKRSNSADWKHDAEYPLDIFPACCRCLGDQVWKPAIGQDGDYLRLDFSDGQTAEFSVRSRSRKCIADTKSREVVLVDTDAGSRGLRHPFFGIFKGAGFWPASVSRCLCIHQYFLGDPFADSVFRVRRKAVPADVVFEGWISRIDGRVCMAHAGLCIRRTFLSRVEKCRPAT